MVDMKKLTVISIFAGCGGSTLGYKLAGFKELLALDWDNLCEKSYKLNFESPFWNADITTVTPEELMKRANIKKGELCILDGSPPCQGFSTAGKRKILDPRNKLFLSFIKLVNRLQPQVFIMENVSGQYKGKMKGLFNEILKELRGTGYIIGAKLLNAANYGVPQARQRIFYIGVRPDLGKKPVFPKPQGKIVSVKEAISDLKDQVATRKTTNAFIKKTLPLMRPGEGGNKYHPKGSYFNSKRVSWNRPASTILTQPFLYHPFEDRVLSILEVKRLCSFPDDFKLAGTPTLQWKQLGNAVMPLQMKAIAETIKKDILMYD
jgi:DNA (cytosine-5)-methyltransferase 1